MPCGPGCHEQQKHDESVGSTWRLPQGVILIHPKAHLLWPASVPGTLQESVPWPGRLSFMSILQMRKARLSKVK